MRTGTNEAPRASATGAPKMNPRASIPQTTSTPSGAVAAIASTTPWNAFGFARIGVMSLKVTPAFGKSGTSWMSAAISSMVT